MFYGGCRKVSNVLSLGLELISESTVHEVARTILSKVILSSRLRYRRCVTVDGMKLRVKKAWIYGWSAVDVDAGELLALKILYGRSCLNALIFLKKAIELCINKPMV